MFQYDAVRSPYVGSIADLIAREGEIRARAALQSGQAWAGATQQVGQTVGGALQQIADPRRQMEQIALDEAKRGQAEQANLRDLQTSKVPSGPQPEGAPPAAPQNPYLKPDGDVSVWDVGGLSKAMAARGTPLSPTSLKAITDLNQAHREEMSARTAFGQAQTNLVAKAAGTMAEILRKSPGADPQQLADLVGQQFAANESFPSDKFKATMGQVLSDPTQVLSKLDALSKLGTQAPIKLGKDETLLNPNDLTAPPLATNVVAPTKAYKPVEGMMNGKAVSASFDEQTGKYFLNGQDVSAAFEPKAEKKSFEAKSVLLDGKPAEVTFDPAKGKYFDAAGIDVSSRVKPIPSAASVAITAGALSDPALEQAAQQYLQTGKLPPGMGGAAVARNAKIMNRAAELDPKAALALNQATFKADSANLTNLQKTEGTLSAFETTAGKNLDQFLTLAAKIPDTGVPWLNRPIRSIDAKLLGSADQAAFNAARDVALREIARVTNDPKLSGVLSDAARQEVSALSPASATFAQIKAVAKVLKQDMANVHSSLTEQINTVKAGLAGHPGASANTRDPMGIR